MLPIFLFQCSSGRSWSVISSRAPKFVLVVKYKFPPWRFSSLQIWNGVVFLCACICSCVLGCGLGCMCAYGGVDEGMFMHVCACMFLQEILNCLLLSLHNLWSHGYKVASTLSDTLKVRFHWLSDTLWVCSGVRWSYCGYINLLLLDNHKSLLDEVIYNMLPPLRCHRHGPYDKVLFIS